MMKRVLTMFQVRDILEKGKRAQIGEVREWDGQKYRKVSASEWTRISEDHRDADFHGEEHADVKKHFEAGFQDTHGSKVAGLRYLIKRDPETEKATVKVIHNSSGKVLIDGNAGRWGTTQRIYNHLNHVLGEFKWNKGAEALRSDIRENAALRHAVNHVIDNSHKWGTLAAASQLKGAHEGGIRNVNAKFKAEKKATAEAAAAPAEKKSWDKMTNQPESWFKRVGTETAKLAVNRYKTVVQAKTAVKATFDAKVAKFNPDAENADVDANVIGQVKATLDALDTMKDAPAKAAASDKPTHKLTVKKTDSKPESKPEPAKADTAAGKAIASAHHATSFDGLHIETVIPTRNDNEPFTVDVKRRADGGYDAITKFKGESQTQQYENAGRLIHGIESTRKKVVEMGKPFKMTDGKGTSVVADVQAYLKDYLKRTHNYDHAHDVSQLIQRKHGDALFSGADGRKLLVSALTAEGIKSDVKGEKARAIDMLKQYREQNAGAAKQSADDAEKAQRKESADIIRAGRNKLRDLHGKDSHRLTAESWGELRDLLGQHGSTDQHRDLHDFMKDNSTIERYTKELGLSGEHLTIGDLKKLQSLHEKHGADIEAVKKHWHNYRGEQAASHTRDLGL